MERPRYTIRYRCADERGRLTLIVEDEHGAGYLFGGGRLQRRFPERHTGARLARLLRRHAHCAPVPEVAPYTLEGLRRLVGHDVERGAWNVRRERAGA
ncbi:MAG TPA: hypothetical protein VFW96_02295 [Thermomicrobiales bacterium]|nr:hypothetical protein [Thermomicrobiales bacterium]